MAPPDTPLPDMPRGAPPNGQALPAGDDAQTERNLAVLAELRDIGLEMAKVIKTRAVLDAAEGLPDTKCAAAFDKIARAVRQVIFLFDEIRGLREKRRNNLVSQRKADAKKLIRKAIDRDIKDASDRPRTEKERQDLRTRADDLIDYRNYDFERFSVAEIVADVCKFFGVKLDPALSWPEWSELRPETPAQPATEPLPPAPPKPAAGAAVPPGLSGASSLPLMGRPPAKRERGPP
jgi:hypothetical protein